MMILKMCKMKMIFKMWWNDEDGKDVEKVKNCDEDNEAINDQDDGVEDLF